MTEDIAGLVDRARRGEAAAFQDLVRATQGRVRAFFATRLWDATLVDDLAQDTFFIAYRRLAAFDPVQPFYPWLRGIALHVLLNEVRKHRPRPESPDQLAAALERLAEEEAERHADDDLLQALHDCLARLGEPAVRVIRDRYESGLALAVLARREGKTAKALAVALVRIRQRLRDCLEAKRLRGSLAEGGAE